MSRIKLPESKIKGIIFDLDGTLLDSLGIWQRIDEEFFASRNIDLPADYSDAIGHLSIRATAEYTIERFSLKDSVEEVMAEWQAMALDAYANHIELKPYAKEFLLKLKNEGVHLAVATGGESEKFTPALKRCGIYDLFESFTTLGEVSRGKDCPDIYLCAAEKLGLKPKECTVFEDLYDAICGAKAGGFCTVGVYEKNAEKMQTKIKETADYYIRSYSQLL